MRLGYVTATCSATKWAPARSAPAVAAEGHAEVFRKGADMPLANFLLPNSRGGEVPALPTCNSMGREEKHLIEASETPKKDAVFQKKPNFTSSKEWYGAPENGLVFHTFATQDLVQTQGRSKRQLFNPTNSRNHKPLLVTRKAQAEALAVENFMVKQARRPPMLRSAPADNVASQADERARRPPMLRSAPADNVASQADERVATAKRASCFGLVITLRNRVEAFFCKQGGSGHFLMQQARRPPMLRSAPADNVASQADERAEVRGIGKGFRHYKRAWRDGWELVRPVQTKAMTDVKDLASAQAVL
ncbi:hypothetical protein AK812_SmicGene42317 [Symbiodinium microadriaticum]|uniref:Uncharacterized protein n=1 Tax=Symbiodinium microadriaticum TaxID=2951 RepID=A0A1Q9C3W7_SYMMI|nr:hypothetical protein AK812_SmicGene42317 [Symbiodinium microadriaticum]